MKRTLELNPSKIKEIADTCRALSSPIRLEILHFLAEKPAIISDIASHFNLPLSSAALHVKSLENVQLITVQPVPGSRGAQKLCGILISKIDINLFPHLEPVVSGFLHREEMPIGCYFDYAAKPSCGIVSELCDLGAEDSLSGFFSPDRFKAQLIWLTCGYLEYRFSNFVMKSNPITRITFTFELCSEALGYNNDWKSDVSVIINRKEAALIECLGDYGGRRGKHNPSWWSDSSTQYGDLYNVSITNDGTYLNGTKVSDINLTALDICSLDFLVFRLEVKEDARYVGGFNLFGEKFGDYPQNIIMEVYNN